MKKLFDSFAIWIAISIVTSLCLRIIEFISILQYHPLFDGLIKYTFLGWGNDMIIWSLLLFLLFPVYWLLHKFTKIANLLFLILFSFLIIIHVLLLQYYAYMLTPLSEFFWVYFPKELIFTVGSSNVSYIFPVICCIVGLFILFLFYYFFLKIRFQKNMVYFLLCVNLMFTIGYGYAYHYFSKVDEKQIPYSILKNKSQYFCKKSLKYFLIGTQKDTVINEEGRAKLFPHKIFFDKEYPLLSLTNYEDVLSPYFQAAGSNPNIVVIIVEGLGERFMGKYRGVELMPFLSGLSEKSLYWKNCIASSERSFGALPSILASAPYGEKGFAFLYQDTTSLSLMNLLSSQGYFSAFFYGQPDWFHDSGPYLRRNSTNRIEHAYTFPEKYPKIMVGDYFWGLNDKDLVTRTLEVIDSLPQSSRIDIIYTGSTHSPFIISQSELYANRLKHLVAGNLSDSKDISFFTQYKSYFETLLFADDALQNLFAGYEQRPNYENTIFIITGDHTMSEIPIENVFDQYHVPLLIYSPRLIKPEVFLSVNSHLDIAPTLLAFLQTQHNIPLPKSNAFIGKSLDTCRSFRCLQPILMMNGEREIEPIVYDKYLIINNLLYELDKQLTPTAISNEEVKKYMQSLAKNFTALNNYTWMNNRLVAVEVYRQEVKGY